MRLQQYINEKKSYKKKTRSKVISLDEIRKTILQYSETMEVVINNKPCLIRDTDVPQKNIYILDPTKGEKRISRNTSNYYTLILDHSKNWAKFPKRSKSIICETKSIEAMFSEQFWIVPKNGAKIGMCPDVDFWYSFKSINDFMNYFNSALEKLLNFPSYTDEEITEFSGMFPMKRRKKFDKNITILKKAMKNFDNWYKKTTMLDMDEIIALEVIDNHLNSLKGWDGKSIFNQVDKILNPRKHGFKLVSIDKLVLNKEAWTDSESLIIPTKNIEEVIQIYKEEK